MTLMSRFCACTGGRGRQHAAARPPLYYGRCAPGRRSLPPARPCRSSSSRRACSRPRVRSPSARAAPSAPSPRPRSRRPTTSHPGTQGCAPTPWPDRSCRHGGPSGPRAATPGWPR
eukprot:scaffold68257_cov66-Phaeocystis_antarctica.AAC.2